MNKFRNAFQGILTGLKHRAIAVQFILAVCAFIAAVDLHLEAMEWVAVIICIGMVISAEMLNTCVEKLCDLYSREYSTEIRDIKDIAAGAVLAASLAALICSLLILSRHI